MNAYPIEIIVSPDWVDQLAEIETESFAHPLERKQIETLLADQNTHFLAARNGETLMGSVWLQTVLDEGYIGNVAVRPTYRRKGIADALLEHLDLLAQEKQRAASFDGLFDDIGFGTVGEFLRLCYNNYINTVTRGKTPS